MQRPLRATRSIHKLWFGYAEYWWGKWVRRGPGRRPALILYSYGHYEDNLDGGFKASVEWGQGVKLPSSTGAGADEEWYGPRPASLAKYPMLGRLLFARRYDGSKQKRDAGTVSLKWSATGWQVTLRDPTSRQCIRAEIPDYNEWMKAAESLLSCDTPPWETDDYAKPRIKLPSAARG